MSNLPKIQDLVTDLESYKEHDELNLLLNQQPPAKWVAKHPIIKKKINGNMVPYEYLPIDKVEHLLRRIFKAYRIEVLREGQMFNAVYVTVRVHYLNPITSEWAYHDGVGAWNIQMDKGSKPNELDKIKASAVVMALPLAKTLAVKDACDMFGKLFGADLNRAETVAYVQNTKVLSPEEKAAKIEQLLEEREVTPEDLLHAQIVLDEKDVARYDKILVHLQNARIKNS